MAATERWLPALAVLFLSLAARAERPTPGAAAEISGYLDSNHVAVTTPTVRVAVRDPHDVWRAGARYLVDVVSAASPDVVATASPRWNEARHVVAVDGGYRWGDLRASGAASVSVEPDYVSLTASATPSIELDHHHVTLAGGYALGHDTIGRSGTSFEAFHRTLWRHAFNGGVSFVLDSSTLLWLGTDVVLERGDQSKPYRYVPMFSADAASKIPAGASAELVNAERLQERPLERLPEGRERFAVTARLLRRFERSTVRAEERLYADTWSQRASTTDLRWLRDWTRRLSVGPSVRFHVQNAVFFWQRAYVPQSSSGGVRLPEYRTGDRELGSLWTLTVGADARFALTDSFANQRASLVLRVAGSHTDFLDALFVSDRQTLFTGVGFEGELD